MDNQENIQNNFELPKPAVEAGGATGGIEYGGLKEQSSSSGGGPAPSVSGAQAGALAALSGAQPTTGPSTNTAVSAALAASDVDLIEKEWVAKAKEIVARTNGDPYVQNKEINKMKADYIKKRYNKDIKQAGE